MPLYGADSFLGWMDNWRSQGLNPKGPLLNTKIKKVDPSVMDSSEIKGEESEEQKYKRIEQEQAFKGAGLPTIGVGDFQLGISDFVTPGGLVKLVAAPAAMLTGAIAIGSRAAGPASLLARTVGESQAGVIKSVIYNNAISKLKLYFDEDAMKEITNPIFYKARDRVVLMPPKTFLTAAEEGIDPLKTAEIAARFAKGDKLPEYRIPEMFVDSTGKMYGHEGRHRIRELEKRGVELVPVRIRTENIRFSEQGTGKFDDLGSKYPSTMITERFEKRDFPVPREEALLPNAGVIDSDLEERLLKSIIK